MSSVLDELPSDLALSPNAVGTYLGVSGWELEYASEAAESWLLTEGGRPRARVQLPLDPTYIDYSKRFDEALRRLCHVYDWDSYQLANNILSARSDLLYIRADQLIRHDSIPLRQAEQLISGTIKLLSAAALSAIDPRASYVGRRPDLVRNFVEDDVRMGHTQRGSFVITVITSLDDDEVVPAEALRTLPSSYPGQSEELEPAVPHDDAAITAPTSGEVAAVDEQPLIVPPFQRRVTSTLANALSETVRIAESANPIASTEAIRSGVSADLCDSLLQMTKYQGLRALDLSFRWAPAETIRPPEVDQVVFTRDYVEPIGAVSRRLRERRDPERLTMIGRVIKLELSERSDEPDEATVTIKGVVERNNVRQVRVTLSGADHDLAIAAYRGRFPIQVTGDLRRTGGVLVLEGDVSVQAIRD
ncbi:hypothetical protein [Prauserella sp. PE36]|uniref:hypothetical protein n=1 Tax=Prauserella sp. PE36 TaxID=1504709 RepID=UPI0011BE297B|nr:hypothetical protein [Prauserella sp. PE36]